MCEKEINMDKIEKKIYDFEQMEDRKGTYSVKYDFVKQYGMPDGIIPLWISKVIYPVQSS